MKTLIWNGSPRTDGGTAALLKLLCERLSGEVRQLNAFDGTVAACRDCRYCRTHTGCALTDGMQDIYPYLEACDTVVMASPVYFSELTGPLLSALSRLQPYYCSRILRSEPVILKPKTGIILLSCGGDGDYAPAVRTATILLHQMNAQTVLPPVIVREGDEDSPTVRAQIDDIIKFL